MAPSLNWGNQKSWPPNKAKLKENKIINENTLKSKLEKMNMNELRDYVKNHNLKAKDTNKDELIEEILEEVGK